MQQKKPIFFFAFNFGLSRIRGKTTPPSHAIGILTTTKLENTVNCHYSVHLQTTLQRLPKLTEF